MRYLPVLLLTVLAPALSAQGQKDTNLTLAEVMKRMPGALPWSNCSDEKVAIFMGVKTDASKGSLQVAVPNSDTGKYRIMTLVAGKSEGDPNQAISIPPGCTVLAKLLPHQRAAGEPPNAATFSQTFTASYGKGDIQWQISYSKTDRSSGQRDWGSFFTILKADSGIRKECLEPGQPVRTDVPDSKGKEPSTAIYNYAIRFWPAN